ncbi:MAG: MliC family protein [Burkholderiaceae bacterium]
MKPARTLAIATVVSLISACAAPSAPPAEPAPQVKAPAPVSAPARTAQPRVRSALSMASGTYRCDLNRSVVVRSVSDDRSRAVLNWNSRSYQMTAVNTASGALRYEDRGSGLTWITIVGKSMLLDTRNGKQLANDCKV